jgi:UDP-N-acetylglucosamine 1-carboxyvinyltransferase
LDKFVVEGPTALNGTIEVSGSKNAALPLMAATLLTDKPSLIRNVPQLNDIYTLNNVLRVTGTSVRFDEAAHTLHVDASTLTEAIAPYEQVRKMRASFYMLGALLGRCGEARVSLPGGCAWGPRPVNLHMEGLKALGAIVEMDKGYVVAHAPGGRLKGGTFRMEPSSVGATVNIVLGAVKAIGTSVIENAAMEPDVVYFCQALNKMGARISGHGTPTITIHGVDELDGMDFDNSPDRIETGTFMIAAAMHPDSDVTITNTEPADMGAFTDTFRQVGATVDVNGSTIRVKAPKHIRPVSITTEIYPGFPTDLQAQWATMMTQAYGSSEVTDTIYFDRFSYVPELVRLGADVALTENTVRIAGTSTLQGAAVMSTDLRASVSLVMAGMVAEGSTDVLRVYHLDRGYETLEKKLNAIGARIRRERQE